MSSLRRYAKYLISNPKLYKIYHGSNSPRSVEASSGQPTPSSPPQYTPSILETMTDATITYIVPITLLLSLYQRKISYVQVTILMYVASRLLRSVSRLTNTQYLQFLDVLDNAVERNDSESVDTLRAYDFEFSYFPVSHSCAVTIADFVQRQEERRTSGILYYVSWVVAHSFGIRLIYPGLILGGVLNQVLLDGRSKLVTEKRGKRVKIQVSSDQASVDIDAMVFDKRGSYNPAASGKNGEYLIICCEGNAGFYEIGMLGGALSEGYSVLGWNHPGFGGSTGTPYPMTELTAAMGVMDYAVNALGFSEERIIVYGWSIGGFPASYIASQYPNIKGLILDATFDTILPLAIPRMPEFMSPLVVSTITQHVNLDNDDNLRKYRGPIRVVRRVDDEIIADPPGVLACNRGNELLVRLVLDRYNKPVSDNDKNQLVDWVNNPHDRDVPAFDSLRGDSILVKDQPAANVIIAMASSILRDYKSTHCTPLPREYYRIESR